MVEVYEKSYPDDEVKRTVYQVLTAREEAIIPSEHISPPWFAENLVDKLCASLRTLVKVNIRESGGRKIFEAEMHLPFIESMVIVRAKEENAWLSRLDKEHREKIDFLEKELIYHRQPWYKKIWRSE